MNGNHGKHEATVVKRRPWSRPHVIRSAEIADSAKISSTVEMYVNPGYAFPRTVGPS